MFANVTVMIGLWLVASAGPETITFEAADGLTISADRYPVATIEAPVIVLFHQAGWSRGEYREIAPRLNRLGFHCLAIDQRSGKAVNGVKNATAARAQQAKKGGSYLDALPDVEAALAFARASYPKSRIIAWGSSYSASLVLVVAGSRPNLVDGALAFAPGEYFRKLGKPGTWVRDSAKKIAAPVFITSAKKEKSQWHEIFTAIPGEAKSSYLPTTKGNHGSRALWQKFDDNKGYWRALTEFLQKYYIQ